jgi:hypothetical protein
MDTNQTVEINVTEPEELQDARVKRWRKLERTVVEELTKRIFYMKTQGTQKFFYDTETDSASLTTSHLIGIVTHEVKQRDSGYMAGDVLSKDNPVRQALRNTNFNAIVLEDRYVPKGDAAVLEHGLYFRNIWRKPTVEAVPYTSIAKARAKGAGAYQFIHHLQLMLGDTVMDLDHPDSKAGYLIRMLAYRYQVHDFTRTQKPHVAFYFYGKQGYGKTIFSTVLHEVFGSSAVMATPDERSLNSMSFVDIFSRTWAVVDEVNIAKGSTDYNAIKTMTGNTRTDAQRKGEHFKYRYIPAQLIMNSQKPPTFIEAGDRRFFISRWDCDFDTPQAKNDYFREYTTWLHDKGGFAAIAGLLKVTDISTVNPEAPAMITPEKRQVVAMVTDDSVQEMLQLIEAAPFKVCWTEQDFEHIFREYEIHKKQFGYKLEEAGLVEQLKHKYEGKKVRKFYLRRGWEIKIANGNGSELINIEKPEDSKLLKTDPGYITAMQR